MADDTRGREKDPTTLSHHVISALPFGPCGAEMMREGGRRECKTEPHVVPLSLRFGSLFVPSTFSALRSFLYSFHSLPSAEGLRPATRWMERTEERRERKTPGSGADMASVNP